MKMHMNRMLQTFRVSNSRGVTLVELMVVIAILAILAAIVSPTIFRTINRQRAAGIATDVANELRRARNQAMSRGEIIIVEMEAQGGGSRGALTTYATNLPDVDGNFHSGTGTCDPDTEAEDCPGGTICLNETCYGEPARSCREFMADADFLREVASYEMDTSDAVNMAIRTIDPMPANSMICFAPDGRITQTGGAAIAGGPPNVCAGENLILAVAKADAPAGEVATASACVADRDDRDPIFLYRISVPYNGAIQVKQ